MDGQVNSSKCEVFSKYAFRTLVEESDKLKAAGKPQTWKAHTWKDQQDAWKALS